MRTTAGTGIVAAAALTLLLSPIGRPGASARQAPLTTSDFPSPDSPIWSMQRRGLLIKMADLRLAQAPDNPETAELLIDAGRYGVARIDQALDVLRRLVAGDPDDVEAAARIVSSRSSDIQRDDSRGYRDDVEELATSIRTRVPALPREQAAWTIRQLIPIENRLAGGRSADARPLIREFVNEYAGTEAALLAQIDMIGFTRDLNEEIEQLEAFARQHAGTVAGAKALYMKGFQLRGNYAITGVEPRGADPTERFMQVLAIVQDLESGRWPPCEWVDKAPELISGFFASDRAVYSPENIERVLDAYRAFVAKHFVLRDQNPTGWGVGYVITSRMARLHELQGDRIGGVEATFEALEREVANIDVLRHLKVEFYIGEAREAEPRARPALIRKAVATLTPLTEAGSEPYARKALATLAALHFYERDFQLAAETYRQYLAQWPDSDWAWVAALRLGQAQEAIGDWEGAAESYSRTARTYLTPAPSAVLANTFAARANETLGRFDEALRHYVEAASSWDDDFGPQYSLYTRHAPATGRTQSVPAFDFVTHADLTERLAQLASSGKYPEGVLLEQGRRLLEQGRWHDARISLEALVSGAPASPLAAEARYLSHRARFENALEIADVEAAKRDEPAAFAEFEALSDEPWDPAVGAATFARAAILGKAGLEREARRLTREALQRWLARQRSHYEPGATGSLRADVAAIRDLVFRPRGGAFYDDSRARWNAFDWPVELPPFLIVNSDISTKLPGGRTARVRVTEDLPGLENVLFMTDEHLGFLYGILNRLGGTETRPPRAVMETPNQPIGASVEILALWKELFPARPGHWGGWDLQSFPIITQIEFQNDERSRATAAVTIGYSGCTVVLEKHGGDWVVVRLTDFWIT